MIDYQYISDLLRNEMYEECYEEIIKGLKQNYKDYELYFALGEYYQPGISTRLIYVTKMHFFIAKMKRIKNIYAMLLMKLRIRVLK